MSGYIDCFCGDNLHQRDKEFAFQAEYRNDMWDGTFENDQKQFPKNLNENMRINVDENMRKTRKHRIALALRMTDGHSALLALYCLTLWSTFEVSPTAAALVEPGSAHARGDRDPEGSDSCRLVLSAASMFFQEVPPRSQIRYRCNIFSGKTLATFSLNVATICFDSQTHQW